VAAEAAEAGHRVGDVDLELFLEDLLLAGVHDRERHGDGVFLHQPLELDQRQQLAVDADDGVAAHLEVEVGRLALDRDLQQIVDVHGRLLAGGLPIMVAPGPSPGRSGRSSSEAAATAAVSTRSTRSPRLIGAAPEAWSDSISASVQPPSG